MNCIVHLLYCIAIVHSWYKAPLRYGIVLSIYVAHLLYCNVFLIFMGLAQTTLGSTIASPISVHFVVVRWSLPLVLPRLLIMYYSMIMRGSCIVEAWLAVLARTE